MKKTSLLLTLSLGLLPVLAPAKSGTGAPSPYQPANTRAAVARPAPLIQIALLLDTSNSMDGLIDQARSQLWRVVTELASARRDGQAPRLEVALYEYGNNSLSAETGHIRRVQAFSSDLDTLSDALFKLKTNGGEEYCGWTVKTALKELAWDQRDDTLKLIFVAGNEPFTQGPVPASEILPQAPGRGIFVSSIFCGDDAEGRRTGWSDGAQRGAGKYLCINQNGRAADPESPYDAELARMNTALNGTYLPYGERGAWSASNQIAQDNNSGASLASRAACKATALYDNVGWDLVDRAKQDGEWTKLPADQLPEKLRGLSAEERVKEVARLAGERERIRKQISEVAATREKWLAELRAKAASTDGKSLQDALVEAVHELAARRRLTFVR